MGRTRGSKIDAEYEYWLAHKDDPPTDRKILKDLVSEVTCGLALDREEDPHAFQQESYEEVIAQLGLAAVESGLPVPDVVAACEMGEAKLAKVGLFNIPPDPN